MTNIQKHLEAHFSRMGDQSISKLLPYTGLITVVTCVVIFMVRLYIFEPVAKKYYHEKYTCLDEVQRRSFINHHVAGSIKIFLVIFAAYPFIAVMSGAKSLHSPVSHHSHITVGDMLIITDEVFCSMYIFELFYRAQVSYISAAHHIGAILIAQSATVLALSPEHRQDGIIEFVLCLLWGE